MQKGRLILYCCLLSLLLLLLCNAQEEDKEEEEDKKKEVEKEKGELFSSKEPPKFQFCSLWNRHPCGYCRCMDDLRLKSKYYCDCRFAEPERDCLDHLYQGHRDNGVYRVHQNSNNVIDVFCQQHADEGGWMVIQRRMDGKTDFFRDWDEYSKGFGDMQHEFWAGNEKIHTMTQSAENLFGTTLHVTLIDWQNRVRFAEYETFYVGGADTNYTMRVSHYDGDAGDLGYGLTYHNGMPFTTFDRNNRPSNRINCAIDRQGGWWYNNCATVNLNGRYYFYNKRVKRKTGIVWAPFNWHDTSLKFVEMKIRRNY